jgi:hypothetical protein
VVGVVERNRSNHAKEGSSMKTYAILRRGGWRSAEELASTPTVPRCP